MKITNKQARQFLLRRHGLLGEHIFKGKAGIMEFINRVGSLQYDPVNICGRTADITLHSRIRDYKQSDLHALLYTDRKLVEYFDKCLNIFPIELFSILLKEQNGGGFAGAYHHRGGEAVQKAMPIIREYITEHGHISPKDIKLGSSMEWFWGSATSIGRATLESMYYTGEIIVHHRRGTNKSYAFTKDYIPQEILEAPMPYNTELERDVWHVKRRIAAFGLMWNKASDIFIGLKMKAAGRAAAFEKLIADGELFEITVEGIHVPLYALESERTAMEAILTEAEDYPLRTEFIAPLDSFIWDRKLIHALFDFEYRWEIYTPEAKRKYGPYTLPILHGDRLIGRIDTARKDGVMVVNGIWMEDGKPLKGQVKKAVDKCLGRFSVFNMQ